MNGGEGPKPDRLCSWWLNIGCAHRDGIVGAASQKPTKGRYGVAALPLLTGSEERLPDGRMEYCRRGNQQEMYYGLLTQVGQKTKVLRGFRLKSMHAPVAGLRYDGMWVNGPMYSYPADGLTSEQLYSQELEPQTRSSN
jgi:hypothetical protein